METIEIIGGTPLQGSAEISGSKNVALSLLAASLTVEGDTLLHNVPLIDDVRTMIEVLRATGAKVQILPDHRLLIRAHELASPSPPYELVQRMRASFYAAGALLSRLRCAEMALPGGCYIGVRPVNFHLDGFKKMGVDIRVEHGLMKARAERLKGTSHFLDPRFASVGTTVNIMLASVLADGETVVENASRDPNATECANFLIKAGAQIQGIGTSTLKIKGVKKLRSTEYTVIPDRIEAGTLLLAGAATRGDVTVRPCIPHQLRALLDAFSAAGIKWERGPDYLRVFGDTHPRGFDVTTAPYPGFSTDLQPPTAILMCTCEGFSVLEETIFESRLKYVGELRRMGANIRITDQTAIINGVKELTGAPVEAQDIRAGAAMVVAGLVARGRTEISGTQFVDRGYERLEEKLQGLGALIRRSDTQKRISEAKGVPLRS